MACIDLTAFARDRLFCLAGSDARGFVRECDAEARGRASSFEEAQALFECSWPPCWSTSVLVLAAAASHMTRERSARVLLAALLDRLPDLRPEVMHVPHRHVSRDEGEDGLAEGEQQRRRREQRVRSSESAHIHIHSESAHTFIRR